MSRIQRVAVIGLDCWEPSLVFGPWLADMPNIRRLCQSGTFGQLTSCLPPITVPAWSCMASSRDPGELGIYGFRNRKDWSYDGLDIALSTHVRLPRVWDLLGDAGKNSIVVGVPGTFPITRPIRGSMVSCFLTPDPKTSEYTWPRELKKTIEGLVGEYLVDIKGFRTDDKGPLLDQIYVMTERRFKVVSHLARSQPWDLLWMVEMGTDRIHHGFWQAHDAQHRKHEPNGRFADAIRKYYLHLDGQIGELVQTVNPQETAILVVSDHGAKRMDGGVCFNDWLIREGYLVLKQPASKPTKFSFDAVDWSRTRVWGEGGYYGRCFINVKGREPQGIVAPGEYEALRTELTRKLEALPDDRGRPMGTRVYRPQDLYRAVNGVPPDLVVIFGDLHWRSVGTVGNPTIYTFENDTGPDDANHAQEGMYILSHASLPARGRVDGPTLYDVAPTILRMLGEPIPAEMCGKPLV